ncbi:hypothetical protein JAAARDRAFT_205085 [Jaapia argillacea MUCL 33604]|uniref:Uncharacterized protein n=1 Tax=Jaapia argillacea MUCL 33604 TaxID=933084 RepID=A0A067QBQ6_9AGAM|nr:hypothetical protein JAAARDRAFT_205085 [Jaapia argillacea MUCL 33604]
MAIDLIHPTADHFSVLTDLSPPVFVDDEVYPMFTLWEDILLNSSYHFPALKRLSHIPRPKSDELMGFVPTIDFPPSLSFSPPRITLVDQFHVWSSNEFGVVYSVEWEEIEGIRVERM